MSSINGISDSELNKSFLHVCFTVTMSTQASANTADIKVITLQPERIEWNIKDKTKIIPQLLQSDNFKTYGVALWEVPMRSRQNRDRMIHEEFERLDAQSKPTMENCGIKHNTISMTHQTNVAFKVKTDTKGAMTAKRFARYCRSAPASTNSSNVPPVIHQLTPDQTTDTLNDSYNQLVNKTRARQTHYPYLDFKSQFYTNDIPSYAEHDLEIMESIRNCPENILRHISSGAGIPGISHAYIYIGNENVYFPGHIGM